MNRMRRLGQAVTTSGRRILLRIALGLVGLAVIASLIYVIIVYGYPTPWTGFSGRTLWEWLSLLGVPVMLALATAGFGLIQERNRRKSEQVERDLAAERARETALQAYLDDMGKLMLDHGLGKAPKKQQDLAEVRALAHAKTLTVLRVLESDTRRRTTIGRFLNETGLLQGVAGLDLSNVDLSRTTLRRVIARGAYLREAKLWGAYLWEADLQAAVLRWARLQGAHLTNANLQMADLKGASFDENTILPDGTRWRPGTDMTRFTDPTHPDFWRSDDTSSPAYRGKDDSP